MRSALPSRRRILIGLGASAAIPCVAPGSIASSQPAPPRIVSLDWGVTQTLVAIGAPPIATPDLRGYRANVVEPALPAEVVDIGLRTEPNLELMAALRPDLILIPPGYRAMQPIFERIATTQAIEIYGGAPALLPRLEAVTRSLAALASRPAEGLALVEQSKHALAAGADPNSRPAILPLRLLDDRHAMVFGRRSLFAAVLERLGEAGAWQGQTNAWGFATTGIEQLVAYGGATLVSIGSGNGILDRFRNGPLWHVLQRSGSRLIAFPPIWAFGTLPSALRFARCLAAA